MSSTAAARRPWISGLDPAIDRVLAVAVRPGEELDAADRMRGFERILLLHLSVRVGTGSFIMTDVSSSFHAVLTFAMLACFALSFASRLAPIAVAGALCVTLALVSVTFPSTGNHLYLEVWSLFLLLFIGRKTREENELLLAAARWSIAIVLFYTGLQKVLYGSYFDAQFLTTEIALKPAFEAVLAPLLPPEELARLRDLVPGRAGSGPYRSDAPLLLIASNLVYLFELVAPTLLLWPKARRAAVVAVFVFTVAIQSGAREAYFGGLLINWILLFWPTNLHRRAFLPFALFYAALAALDYLAPGQVV